MIQESFFSGLFYPSQKSKLVYTLETLCSNVNITKRQNVKAIISPHAGYQFSGKQAAEAFLSIQNRLAKTIVVLSPSHQHSFDYAAILDADAYQTPLGRMPINKKVVTKLTQAPFITVENSMHHQEHGIEVLIPFIQYTNAAQTIVPIVIGSLHHNVIEGLTDAIQTVTSVEDTIIVASSDFSHFFPRHIAVKMDQLAVDILLKQDETLLKKEYLKRNIQLCGIAPTLTMLNICKKWEVEQAEHLSYSHSGIQTKDVASVVGYNSMRFF